MAYLNEHQPPPNTPTEGESYQPSDEDKKDIKLAEKLLEQSKKFKSKYDKRWVDWYAMFRGNQWKEQRPSYRHSEVVNLIFAEIQSGVPIQLDSRPKFEFMPMEPGDFELATIMNQICEADWNKYNWLAQITENIYDSNILGTGIGACCFDQKKDHGLGAIVIESEDPFYHFPAPNSRNFNHDMPYHIKAEPMTLEEIKRKWPNGKWVKGDVINIAQMNSEGGKDNNVQVVSPSYSGVVADSSQQYSNDEVPQALVVTVYLAGDFEIEENKVEEPSTDGTMNVKYVQAKKYPNGRKLVIANKVVLENGPNEYDDGKIPYARVQNYVNQRQFWGISDIEPLESPQKVFNKLVSFTLDVLTLMGNPIWVVDTDSGVDTDNLFNTPGLVVEKNKGSEARREEGVQLQPYVLQVIDRVKSWFDDLSGRQDVSRGARPEGVTAASAIVALQEAAQTRIRQKARNLDAYLQDLGQLYMARVFQFYTAPRVFRLTNKDGSMKFFKFHMEHYPQEDGSVKKVARYRPFNQDESGQFKDGEEKVVELSGTLDVKVNTGSTLPFAKADAEQRAFALFDRQIIDDEEVLKRLDYPNWEAVLARVNQKKQDAMMQQAQQAPPQ